MQKKNAFKSKKFLGKLHQAYYLCWFSSLCIFFAFILPTLSRSALFCLHLAALEWPSNWQCVSNVFETFNGCFQTSTKRPSNVELDSWTSLSTLVAELRLFWFRAPFWRAVILLQYSNRNLKNVRTAFASYELLTFRASQCVLAKVSLLSSTPTFAFFTRS